MRIPLLFASSVLLIAGVQACKPDPNDDSGTDTSGTSGGDTPGYSELAAAIDGGVLLSAANVGDELVLVGGQLASQPGVTSGGPGYLVRWSNGELCYESDVSEHTLWWIDASSADEWYAVGEEGTIIHEQGGTRVDESVPTSAVLYGVFDHGDRVHAVGGDVWETKEGEIWERDAAGQWTVLAEQLPGVVFKVWERWFVGAGVAWYLDGDTLVERFPPGGERLLTVHGNDAGEVWAVGGQQLPVVLHWEGDAWESVSVDPQCAINGLNGVWVSPEGDVWIAGFFGGLGVYRDGAWECPESPLTREHFHAVREHEGSVVFSGGNLFDAGDNYGTLFHYGEAEAIEMSGEIGPCP